MNKPTLTLTEQQRERAKQMLDQLDSESEPLDFLDEWREKPDLYQSDLDYEEMAPHFVPVEKIVGTEDHNVNRLVSDRMRRVLETILDGDFKKESRYPPHLVKVDGEYFVSADGNHRVIAHKYIGIEEIYAEVTWYY